MVEMIYKLNIPGEIIRFQDRVRKAIEFKWIVKIEKVSEKRSQLLNNALHLWFQMIAEALNDSGQYMKVDFFKDGAHVNWTLESIKEIFWRPLQVAMFNKESSADLTNREACEVIEGVIRILGEVFELTVNFPNHLWSYYEKNN